MPTADELGVESVLEVVTNIYGLEGRERGDELDILCPNPGHPDTDPSTGVNLDTGLWNCFSCGVAGDLIGLGVYVFDLPQENPKERRESREHVAQMIRPHTPEALYAAVKRRLEAALAPRRRETPVQLPGPYEPAPLGYLRRRGFSQETLRRWGVRWVPEETLQGKKGEFTIRQCIAIPIRDERGTLLNWCYRATEDSPNWQPRYLYFTEGINELWFGLQHHAAAKDIVVVEGALDTMWLDQCTYPALGLLGANMGERKLLALQRYRSVTILGDRDAAGAKTVARIGKAIGMRMPVRVARYPRWVEAGDPQELHGVDVEILIESAIPWTLWLQKSRTSA